MKNYVKISVFTEFLLFCWESSAQGSFKSDSRGKINPLHISLDNFPTDNPINYMEGWGGMVIAVNEMSAGTDFGPQQEFKNLVEHIEQKMAESPK